MKIQLTVTAVIVVGLAAGQVSMSSAQGIGGGPGGQGPGGPGGSLTRGVPMMNGGPGGINPVQANPMGLLQRSEVQNELGLDLKQKNAIAELQGTSREAIRQRMQKAMQGRNPQEMRNMTPEQRRASMQEMQSQMQAAMQAWQGELNDKIKEILKPEQVKRLYQLDKQRRGPLSLADPKVAQETNLTPDHRQVIQQIFQEYQQQQGEVIRAAFESMQQTANPQAGRPPQLPDLTSRLSPWRQKLDKIRKASEEKVMAALNEDERAAWKAAIGDPFTFRTDSPGQRADYAPGFGPGGAPPAPPSSRGE